MEDINESPLEVEFILLEKELIGALRINDTPGIENALRQYEQKKIPLPVDLVGKLADYFTNGLPKKTGRKPGQKHLREIKIYLAFEKLCGDLELAKQAVFNTQLEEFNSKEPFDEEKGNFFSSSYPTRNRNFESPVPDEGLMKEYLMKRVGIENNKTINRIIKEWKIVFDERDEWEREMSNAARKEAPP